MDGVSVIICCYNSADVLPETLEYIAKQVVDKTLMWEVILVDNASTDNTSVIAKMCWDSYNHYVSFKVVFEGEPGLSHARLKGISEASFSFLLFCDDDNLLASDYIQTGYSIMTKKTQVALLGGKGEPRINGICPDWFDRYAYQYAVGAQAAHSKDITIERGFVYGAGSFLRASAYQDLIGKGFKYTLTGRKGKSLVSGEDNELGYALSLLGYSIYYDASLNFIHVLSTERLSFSYLKSLKRAVAYSAVLLIPYTAYRERAFFNKPVQFNFYKQLLLDSLYILNGLMRYPFASPAFKIDIKLDQQARFGKIKSLWENRKYLSKKEYWLSWLK